MNDDLNKLRRKIDNLDKDLVKILNKRAELAKTIKKIKDSIGETDIFKPSREAQILRSLKKINKGPLLAQHLQSIYREIISSCLSLEKKLFLYEWHVQKGSDVDCKNCWFTSAVSQPMGQGNSI